MEPYWVVAEARDTTHLKGVALEGLREHLEAAGARMRMHRVQDNRVGIEFDVDAESLDDAEAVAEPALAYHQIATLG